MSVAAIRPRRFPWFRYDGYTFSLGLTDGERAWLSGHSASRYDARAGRIVVTGGMAEQAETAYDKIETILEAAGLGWDDVTRIVENVTAAGIDRYPEAARVRERRLGDATPAVATVVVERLLRRDALVEVEVDAARGADGDAVHLPTIVPLTAGGAPVADDLAGQYRWCLQRAGARLAEGGMGLEHVVKVIEQSTPATAASYPGLAAIRHELLGPVHPAAAAVLASRLHAPGVLVALDVVASRQPKTAIDPGWPHHAELAISPAVRAGSALHLSGLSAVDPATGRELRRGDVVGQARVAYERVLQLLDAAGAGPEHLVTTIEYVALDGLPDYRGVAEVRRELLREPWPASTGAVCPSLPAGLVEVDATARLPG